MPNEKIRIDQVLLSGAEFFTRSIGHGESWDAGLGHLVGRVVDASNVSKRPISVRAARSKVGLTDANVQTAQALLAIGRRLAGR